MSNSYTIWTLWQQGDAIIKFIALCLLAMSISSWSIIFMRVIYALRAPNHSKKIKEFWRSSVFSEGLITLQNTPNLTHMATHAQEAMKHYKAQKAPLIQIEPWLNESLRGAIDYSIEQRQQGLTWLASVAAIAPFVGLFGTVWGIYHALISIAQVGQASIDKVAGPVGEALIMTAFGLAVAIPALLAYNLFTRANRRHTEILNHFARQLHAYFMTGQKFTY